MKWLIFLFFPTSAYCQALGGGALGGSYGTPLNVNGFNVTSATTTAGLLQVGNGGPTNGANASLTITPPNASSTGTVINAPSGNTADIEQFFVNGTTVTQVGPNGHFQIRRYTKSQINTLVPDFLGAEIICQDCTVPYTHCTATGPAADQWRVSFATTTSPGGVAPNGCGGGN